jgi:hypothetical protein
MNIRKTTMFLGLLTVLLFSSCDESSDNSSDDSVDFAGTWRYNISWRDGIATTRVESTDDGRIVNNRSGSSGTIKLKLYFTSSRYEGGSINGYVMVDKSFDTLEAGYQLSNVNFADTAGVPPPGIYYATLVLLEYDGEFYIQDYINFDDSIIIYNVTTYDYYYYYYYYY